LESISGGAHYAYRSYSDLRCSGDLWALKELLMSDEGQQAQLDIAHAVEAKDPDNVKTVVPIGQTDDHTLQIFQVIPKHGPSSVETVNLVEQLRQVDVNVQGTDVRLGVTGLTGGNIDVSNTLAQKLPLYLAVVMGLSFIVLILVFRSILVPLVASVGFLFSILASFGAVVAVYQMGFMGTIFGVHDPGPILAFLPTLMIGILFGLAMDYQVFLVSGMREAYVHGKDAKTAVVAGYNHAVRVVVAAMIIMISVFGGFIFAESAMIRPIGFGLAFGVLVTALTRGMNLDVCSYMFGSILAMTNEDVILSVALSLFVTGLFVLFYNRLFLITYNEDYARSLGINVTLYQFLISFLTALTVVLGMRMMGTLLISSLIILPAVTARRLVSSFRALVAMSACISLVCFAAGLALSFVWNLPTGASIVSVNVAALMGAVLLARLMGRTA